MSVLQGIRIIELAHERTAFAGKLLADMGADVILVEPPEGTPARLFPPFVVLPCRSTMWPIAPR